MAPFEVLVAFGDSITSGSGATTTSNIWGNIVADRKRWSFLNSGLTNTTLQNTVQNTVSTIGGAVDNNGRDTYTARVVNKYPDWVCILYGLNDIRLNDGEFTALTFENDLRETVQGLIDAGIDASHIVIGSPPYIPSTSYPLSAPWNAATSQKFTDYIAACVSVSSAKGTRYVDVYQRMADNGGDDLISGDNIHPNDTGHRVIAEAFLSVL